MRINVRLIGHGDAAAVMPRRATAGSAGADLVACITEEITILPGATSMIPTGIAIEVPQGYAAFVYARSGLACKHGLAPANCVGVIDSDYRGEIMVALHNQSQEAYTVSAGERIAQMVISPVAEADFAESELSETERGAGGFGSTGKAAL